MHARAHAHTPRGDKVAVGRHLIAQPRSVHTHAHTQEKECRDCKAEGNGQFVKSEGGEMVSQDRANGLESMSEIKARRMEEDRGWGE